MNARRFLVRVATTAAFAAPAVALTVTGTVAAATISESSVVAVDLSGSGSGTIDQFDPSLGTLTSVSYTLQADAEVQACMENTSVSSAAASGTGTGSLTVSLGGGSASASTSLSVPSTALAPGDGTLQSATGYDAATYRFPAPVSSADAVFGQNSNAGSDAATLTDAGSLATFSGTGTVAFNWSATSVGNLSHPADASVFFVAGGVVTVNVTYTYTPPTAPTTTTAPATTLVSAGTLPVTGGTDPTATTVAGPAAPTTSIPAGTLPVTGAGSGPFLPIGAALVMAGLAAVAVTRRRTAV